MSKLTVALVGYGSFGQFMAGYLEPFCTVVPLTRTTPAELAARGDIVIFAVPWDGLAAAVARVKPHVRADAILVDVTSVKQKPLTLLEQEFPTHELLGTHPIFGPQSGKNGITGLPIVLCNVSCSTNHLQSITAFLRDTLKLKIIEQTPQQHDQEMAEVQGLTHFIGRALLQLDIPSHLTNTKSYEQLLSLKSLLQDDSWELFKTIQNTNPEAAAVRQRFLAMLHTIEADLNQEGKP